MNPRRRSVSPVLLPRLHRIHKPEAQVAPQARPNPSLESGPSEAGHLAREPGQGYSSARGQGAHPLRAPQLKR
jgi:hypothetical protein